MLQLNLCPALGLLNAGKMRYSSRDHCYSQRLGAGLLQSKKQGTARAARGCCFRSSTHCCPPGLAVAVRACQGKAGLHSTPAVAGCMTQPAGLAVLTGKEKGSVWTRFSSLSV